MTILDLTLDNDGGLALPALAGGGVACFERAESGDGFAYVVSCDGESASQGYAPDLETAIAVAVAAARKLSGE